MKNGFSVLEVMLATALFMIFATGAIMVVAQGYNANRLGIENTQAAQFAAEGIEAVKSIKNQGFANLVNTSGCGLIRNAGNVWAFQTTCTNNTLTHNSADNYIRTIKVENVNRDASGNIVASGGTLDSDTKKVTSTVTWNFNSARPETTALITYLSDWRRSIGNGILVYGDGGTTSDAIKYRIFDAGAGTWNTAAPTADVDGTPLITNKALRAVRVYASATRNEKVAISRHYNGSAQFIYAQVFNGSTWGNVVQLSTWTATTFLDVYNFDGVYLSNGNFMAVYSDNTTTPKVRTWNGSSWTAQTSAADMGGIPNNIVVRNRTGTNEALMATFDQNSDTNTSYFDGAAWSTAIEHSAQAPTNTKEFVDFTWSAQNPSKGALIYSNSSSDKAMNIRICTAPCGLAASWGTTQNTPTSQGTLGAMEIDSRIGAEEFIACDKDANNDIYCFRSNTTPTWTNPVNQILTTTTDTGIQRSFDVAYEATSGTEGIAVYSDTTSTPKLKKYTAGSNTFDLTATNLNTLGGALKTVKLRPVAESDDIMILMGDANRTLYTVIWNGSTNSVYTTPTGKAFTTQGTNGSLATEYWYGFAWDKH